jgi:hypothetical protein
MFTLENTEGFTQEDLNLLNSAVELMMSKIEFEEDQDESKADCLKYCESHVNNRWNREEPNTIESLTCG